MALISSVHHKRFDRLGTGDGWHGEEEPAESFMRSVELSVQIHVAQVEGTESAAPRMLAGSERDAGLGVLGLSPADSEELDMQPL